MIFCFSYFNYIQKLTYFGYDEVSSTYKTFFTKDPYRNEGNKPSNSLKIFSYDNILQYLKYHSYSYSK